MLAACSTTLNSELLELKEESARLAQTASAKPTWINREASTDGAIWISSVLFEKIAERFNELDGQDRRIYFAQNGQGGHLIRVRISCPFNVTKTSYVEPRGDEPVNLELRFSHISSGWRDESDFELSFNAELDLRTKLYWHAALTCIGGGFGDKARVTADGSEEFRFRIINSGDRLVAKVVAPNEFVIRGEVDIAQMRRDIDDVVIDLREEGLLDELFSIDQSNVFEGTQTLRAGDITLGELTLSTELEAVQNVRRGWDLLLNIESDFARTE